MFKEGEKVTKLELGKNGENVACQCLEKQGFCIIQRNFKCKVGEIDIIATDKNELVFIEVKTRCSRQYGEAREAVTEVKKKHIKKATEFYIHTNRLENCCVRFDVMELYLKNDKFYIQHIKNTLW